MKRVLATLALLALVASAVVWVERSRGGGQDLGPGEGSSRDAHLVDLADAEEDVSAASARIPAPVPASRSTAQAGELRLRSVHGLTLTRLRYRAAGDAEWHDGEVAPDGSWSRPEPLAFELRVPGHLPTTVSPDADEVPFVADALFVLCGPSLRDVVVSHEIGASWLPEELRAGVEDAVTSGWISAEEFALAMDSGHEWFDRAAGELELEMHIAPLTHLRLEVRPERGMRERHCLDGEPQWGSELATADLQVVFASTNGEGPCELELRSTRASTQGARHLAHGEWGSIVTQPLLVSRHRTMTARRGVVVFPDVPLGERLSVTGVDLASGDHGRTLFEHTGVPQALVLANGVQLVGRVACRDGCDDDHALTADLIVAHEWGRVMWSGDRVPLELDEHGAFRWPVPSRVPANERFSTPMPRRVEVLFAVDGHTPIRRTLDLPEAGELPLEDLVFEARWVAWRLSDAQVADPDELRHQRLWRSDQPDLSFELHRVRRAEGGRLQLALVPSEERADQVTARTEHAREVDLEWRPQAAQELLVSTPAGGVLAFEHEGGADYRDVASAQQTFELSWSDFAAAEGHRIAWGIEWSGMRVLLGDESAPSGSLMRTRQVRVPATGVRCWMEIRRPSGMTDVFAPWVTSGEPVRLRAD